MDWNTQDVMFFFQVQGHALLDIKPDARFDNLDGLVTLDGRKVLDNGFKMFDGLNMFDILKALTSFS